MNTLTVVIPCYNEESVLPETYKRLVETLGTLSDLTWSLLFVDDGSQDGTPQILEELSRKDPRVQLLCLSRNFGHQAALTAGLRYTSSDLALIMDADLQDPPEVVPHMWKLMKESGANVVYGVRNQRKGESWLKKTTAKAFYRLLNYMTQTPFPVDTGDFRLIDRQVLDTFRELPEHNKYVRGLISWMGFRQVPFHYDREERQGGHTKYKSSKMIHLAMSAIRYFSDKPLRVASQLGFISVLLGLILGAWTFLGKVWGFTHPEEGWTSIVIIFIFFGGVQLLSIGLIGQYIGVIFEEVKSRPEYIISSKKNIPPSLPPSGSAQRESDLPTQGISTPDPTAGQTAL